MATPRPNLLFSLAAFVIIVAGMRAASGLFVPFLLSVFIAVISFPLLDWLHERGVPQWLALLTVIFGVACVGMAISMVVNSSIVDFSQSLPVYEAKLRAMTTDMLAWLGKLGIDLPREGLHSMFDLTASIGLASRLLMSINSMLSNAFLILLTVSFILLEAWNIPGKLRIALPEASHTLHYLSNLSASVRKYIGIKAAVSLGTGIVIGLWLVVIGVDFALLWGLLACLLNFVPTVGSIIAGVPAVLLALIQGGPGLALLAAAGYLSTNMVMGNIVEPRILGRGLGLSALVVFLSLVFWGWVFGPIGMLLSVPLTMVAKVALEASESTRWMAILMGPSQAAIRASADELPAELPGEPPAPTQK